MHAHSPHPSTQDPAKSLKAVNQGVARRFMQIAVLLLLQASILFIGAGTFRWAWAWVYLGIYIVGIAVNGVFMMRNARETIAERARPKEMRNWDKLVGGLWSLNHFLALPLIAALDIRNGWSDSLSLTVHLAGCALFVAGLTLFSWSMITNSFFSTTAEIQGERGHTVCRSGPYQFIRHPGYTGANLQTIGLALLLGSLWALAPAVLAVVLMITRASLEDRMLQAELPGYQEYIQEVRYRLVPGVW